MVDGDSYPVKGLIHIHVDSGRNKRARGRGAQCPGRLRDPRARRSRAHRGRQAGARHRL